MATDHIHLSLLDHIKGTFTNPMYYLYVPYFPWWTTAVLFFLGMVIAGLFFTTHFAWRILPELPQSDVFAELTTTLSPEVEMQWIDQELHMVTSEGTVALTASAFLTSVAVVAPFILTASTLATGVLEVFLLYLLFQLNRIRLTFGQTIHLSLHILLVAQVITQFSLMLYGDMPLPLFSLTFWVISLYLLFSWQRSALNLSSSQK